MKKLMNRHVENTQNQINNTLRTLQTLGLVRVSKSLVHEKNSAVETLTWGNHKSGRHNAGDSFNTLNQYATIYDTGAYHCILFDGSIIRVFYEFDKNILKRQSLLFWPAPIPDIPESDVDELGMWDALSLYLGDLRVENTNFRMRTPVRFDYDSGNDTLKHPGTHVHMQHSECRIGSRAPLCFNTFISFIFQNFYPDKTIAKWEWSNLEKLNYSGFKENMNAIINL